MRHLVCQCSRRRSRSVRTTWSCASIFMGAVSCFVAGCAGPDEPIPRFDVTEKSILELGQALEMGQISSQDLVRLYRDRIEAFDRRGPALNAVVVLNPDADDEAALRDAERASGAVRGPLHGIPVLLKDNYDTANMPTTAGTLGLATSIPPDDAYQVSRLKEAGAVVLGKTNMHELARGITTVGSLIGQTRNPYDPTRNPGGSSGGTGAAIAASFAAAGMGSDTCGSIRIPSAHQALVGLRGTRGLASGDGIVPLSRTQDIGGPLARTVEDLAIMLDATVGYDPADPTTELSRGRIPDTYRASLDPDRLRGARIGIVEALMGSGAAEQPVRDVVEAAIEQMTGMGAEFVDVDEPELIDGLQAASVIGQEFAFHFDAYLRETPGAPVRTLRDMVDLGLYHDIVDRGLQASLAVESLDTAEYQERMSRRREVRAQVVDLMAQAGLDALIYPTIRETARPIGQAQPGSNCALSAVTGLPAITVPGGFAEDGMPVGVEFLGTAFAEETLLGFAFAFEQATGHRREPDFTPSLIDPPRAVDLEVTARGGGPGTVSGRMHMTLHPSTRELDLVMSVYGVRDDEVVAVDIHRRSEDADRGPSLRWLTRRQARTRRRLTLTGRELTLLRDGALYVDVHTIADPRGSLRFDVGLPEEQP